MITVTSLGTAIRAAAPVWAAVSLAVAVAACGDTGSGGSSAALDAEPDDPRLAGIYRQSCRACHADPATGAPLTGDEGAWRPRLDKGMATLVRNTVEGYKGMPPLGGCSDCTRDDFRALIGFMARREEPNGGQSSP